VKPWISAAICSSIFAVIFAAIIGYYYTDYRFKEQRSHEWAIYLVSCKTDDLNAETFESHFRINYPYDYDGDGKKMHDEMKPILKSNPDAMLFHYNTPEKIWAQLGGRKGYAIFFESKILWERKMKQS
jgi:hypothetical protein